LGAAQAPHDRTSDGDARIQDLRGAGRVRVVDHVGKLDVFRASRTERGDATTVVQVQVRDGQAQRRVNRLRMPDELAGDSNGGRAGSNSNQ
jgi:hypothetical protein